MESGDEQEWSFRDRLIFAQAIIQRHCELLLEEVNKYCRDIDSREQWDQAYLMAHFWMLARRLLDASKEVDLAPIPATTIEDFQKQAGAIEQVVGIDLTTASRSPDAVRQRLESMKRLVGDRFAKDYKDSVNRHRITSPIEQIFLLEWKCAAVDDKLGVTLTPQAEVSTPSGTYRVDYLINKSASGQPVGRIAVELDGHEFHQKTKEQVASDNRRQRALTRSGITVLRFSGSEIMRNSKDCLADVVAMIEQL